MSAHTLWAKHLWRSVTGAMAVEFVLVFPLFLTILAASFEFAYDAYLRAQIDGIVAKAARDVTLESASSDSARAALDATIGNQIRQISRQATVSFQLESFRSYASARDPAEPFLDTNENGRCDAGESYEDLNGDGSYSSDSSIDGLGGADDVAVYTITARYQRLFGLLGLMGLPRQGNFTATRMFRIQPYSVTRPVIVRTC